MTGSTVCMVRVRTITMVILSEDNVHVCLVEQDTVLQSRDAQLVNKHFPPPRDLREGRGGEKVELEVWLIRLLLWSSCVTTETLHNELVWVLCVSWSWFVKNQDRRKVIPPPAIITITPYNQ